MVDQPKITIDEFKINGFNLGKKFVDISFGYTSTVKGFSNKDRISKKFNIGDNVISFVMSAMSEIRKATGTDMAMIEKEEAMKEKLTNTMMRFLQELGDLGKIKEHEKYMRSYNRLNSYKVNYPEIEVQIRKPEKKTLF
jgi:hypothetical protein